MTTLSEAAIWTIIIVTGLGTFALRLSFIGILRDMDRVPAAAIRALELVPAAVLAALVTPALFRPGGVIDITLGNERLLAGMAAAAVAWFSSNMLATIAAGMVALWIIQWVS